MTDARCTRCNLRLSVADTDGTCLFCKDLAAAKLTISKGRRPARKYDLRGNPLCSCGAIVAYRGKCSPCAAAESREKRAAAKGGMSDGGDGGRGVTPGKIGWKLR